MAALRLHWHGGRNGGMNFGDVLSPVIVEMVSGRSVRYAHVKNCDLVAIGSLMNKVVETRWKRWLKGRLDAVRVWGTGSLYQSGLRPTKSLVIAAVRGPATRAALGLEDHIALGDPGLLANRLMRQSAQRKHVRWGIIPHVDDRRDATISQIANDNSGAALIDLESPDPVSVVQQIAQCEFVISTSLHGLIVADALGIPNRRLRVGDRISGGDWKFLDYAGSVGRRDLAALTPQQAHNLKALEDQAGRADPAMVTQLSDGLVASFASLGL